MKGLQFVRLGTVQVRADVGLAAAWTRFVMFAGLRSDHLLLWRIPSAALFLVLAVVLVVVLSCARERAQAETAR